MNGIIDKITEFITELLKSWITHNLTNMFNDVNTQVGTIATEVGKTPTAWNSGVFNMVKGLSENVMMPIAGMIISFVLVYELIMMTIDRNNMNEVDSFTLYKYLLKAAIGVMILSRAFDITMAVFDVGNHIVTSAGTYITGHTSLDVEETLVTMFNNSIDDMELGELIQLGFETFLISICMDVISLLITVILYGRMVEIYLWISVAPIPAATAVNREWGTIGSNYLKGLGALALQGFFIMVCVAIYSVLVTGLAVADNLHTALVLIAAYTVLLCFCLFKTGTVARSVLDAH